MHPEAAFLTGYALVLVLVAAGLEALGRRPTNPGMSRTLAACKSPGEPPREPADDDRADDRADWPHSEAPAFHRAVGAVALAAALLITAVSAFRYHGPVELVIHGGLLVVITTRIRRVIILPHNPAFGERRRSHRDMIGSPDTKSLGRETR